MQKHPSRFVAVLVLSLACGKDSAPPSTAPGDASAGDTPAVAAATDEAADTPNCSNNYDVVGAVRSGVLTESIGGQSFTDASPFQCMLTTASQQVSFAFNDSSTDPASQCKYALSYTAGGVTMPSPQTLSCSNAELQFVTTATPDSGDSNCRGKQPIVLDPKIKLKTNNCGGDVDE